MIDAEQRAILGRYVRFIADELGLDGWVFVIPHAELDPDDGTLAQITITYGQQRAIVEFASDLAEYPLERRRHVIVHELLHCYTPAYPPGGLWGIEPLIGTAASTVLAERIRHDAEHVTDALATAFARHMPLPVASKDGDGWAYDDEIDVIDEIDVTS